MQQLKSNKGLTLVEIIVSIAVLGIIIASILSMFDVSISETFKSGSRSNEAMEVQKIVDDLQAEFPKGCSTTSAIITYLTAKGYNKATTLNVISTKVGSYDVNYFVEYKTITTGAIAAKGSEVRVLKFFNKDKNSVQLTTFIPRSAE